jgi:hypothetical protein
LQVGDRCDLRLKRTHVHASRGNARKRRTTLAGLWNIVAACHGKWITHVDRGAVGQQGMRSRWSTIDRERPESWVDRAVLRSADKIAEGVRRSDRRFGQHQRDAESYSLLWAVTNQVISDRQR